MMILLNSYSRVDGYSELYVSQVFDDFHTKLFSKVK